MISLEGKWRFFEVPGIHEPRVFARNITHGSLIYNVKGGSSYQAVYTEHPLTITREMHETLIKVYELLNHRELPFCIKFNEDNSFILNI